MKELLGMKLNSTTAHIWPIDVTHMSLPNVLSAVEKERLSSFYFTKDKILFNQSHCALRFVLSHYLSESPVNIKYDFTAHGKPFLKNRSLQFNLSHSDKIAVIAVTADADIGVDIENLIRDVEYDELGNRFFSEAEYSKLCNAKPEEKRVTFFNCWTRKEAFIKAIGEGLSYPLNEFEVTMLPNEPIQITHIQNDPESTNQWTLASKDLGQYKIAAAVKHQNCRILYRDFNELFTQYSINRVNNFHTISF